MSQDEFVSAKNGEFWNPTVDVATKQPREVTENSYIVGTFLGYDTEMGPKKNSNLYRFEVSVLEGVKLSEPKIMSFWGSMVLDDMLLVKARIQEGMRAKIQWLGKKTGKKAGSASYHDWDVLLPKGQSTTVNAPVDTKAPIASAPKNVASVPAPAATTAEEDDEMPF